MEQINLIRPSSQWCIQSFCLVFLKLCVPLTVVFTTRRHLFILLLATWSSIRTWHIFQNPLYPKAIREAGQSYRTHSKQPIYWESLNAKLEKIEREVEYAYLWSTGNPIHPLLCQLPFENQTLPFILTLLLTDNAS